MHIRQLYSVRYVLTYSYNGECSNGLNELMWNGLLPEVFIRAMIKFQIQFKSKETYKTQTFKTDLKD